VEQAGHVGCVERELDLADEHAGSIIAMGRYDVDLGVRSPQRNHQVAEEVQKAGIIFMDLSCSIVAQELIDSGLSAGIVTVLMAVHHVESFSCVGMIEAQAITKPIGQIRMRDGDHQRAQDTNKKKSRILEIVATQEITTSLQTDFKAVRILPSRGGMFVALAHG
jgi:hypothetical protein